MRRFPTRLAVAALAVVGGFWGARMLAPTTAPRERRSAVEAGATAAAAASPEAIASGGDGNALILQVLERLERRPNIAAKVRKTLRLGNDRLSGEGEFWQAGVGNQRRSRWEVKTLIDGDAAYVTQVYDGEDVWTDRKLPGLRKITRIDMGTVRRELSATPKAGQGPSPTGGTPLELLARGGLSQLVAGLQRCFTFGPDQTLRRGQRTVRAVIGTWRPEALERIWPSLSTRDPAEWPSHLPHHVLVYVDNDDVFPYLIEYRGPAQASLSTAAAGHFPAHDALAVIEFVDVYFATPMPASLFQFSPAEINWHDVTGRVIDQLRPPAPAAEASTARRQGTWR